MWTKSGCLVCPLCRVVIELYETYGHFVPIVNDVEINRHQPKSRMHPMATHLPIGLFPFAFLGAGFLLVMSIIGYFAGLTRTNSSFFAEVSPVIDNITLIFLAVAVVSSALTFLSGYLDWKKRYGGRAYRMIDLKIRFSGAFLVAGILTIILHPVVFNAGMIGVQGLISFTGCCRLLCAFQCRDDCTGYIGPCWRIPGFWEIKNKEIGAARLFNPRSTTLQY